MSSRRAVVFMACLCCWGRAWGVGLEGPADASRRLQVSGAAGWDRVAGFGTSGYAFLELGARGEALVWKHLALSLNADLRQDVAAYDYALERMTSVAAPAFAAQLEIAYDGPKVHIGGGPWVYGSGRSGDYRVGGMWVVPFGVLRARFGSLDGDYVTIQLADGTPLTANGGTALRLAEHFRCGDRHLAAGVYWTGLENTAGFVLSDEHVDAANRSSWIYSVLVGTNVDEFLAQMELAVSVGRAFW
jgi:hypothetical protein